MSKIITSRPAAILPFGSNGIDKKQMGKKTLLWTLYLFACLPPPFVYYSVSIKKIKPFFKIFTQSGESSTKPNLTMGTVPNIDFGAQLKKQPLVPCLL